jgi:DNA-binding transcriptional ArsR family regulator
MDASSRKLYDMKAQVMQALAHPTRLAIVDLLADGERCVCDIAEKVGGERTTVSRHLALMQQAGLLTSRKDGLMVLYNLKTPCILKFLGCVSDVLRQNHAATAQVLRKL